jgi:hypothetical protein
MAASLAPPGAGPGDPGRLVHRVVNPNLDASVWPAAAATSGARRWPAGGRCDRTNLEMRGPSFRIWIG